MPNCFSLTRKSDPKAGPVKLATVDEEMCAHFDAHCDPKQWFCNWYNEIGLALALGRDWEWMRDNFNDEARPIIDWLDENFTADAWYQGR